MTLKKGFYMALAASVKYRGKETKTDRWRKNTYIPTSLKIVMTVYADSRLNQRFLSAATIKIWGRGEPDEEEERKRIRRVISLKFHFPPNHFHF